MGCLYLFCIITLDVAPFLLIFFVSTVLKSKVLLLGPALYQKSKMQQNLKKKIKEKVIHNKNKDSNISSTQRINNKQSIVII